jgi:hypothetical protein
MKELKKKYLTAVNNAARAISISIVPVLIAYPAVPVCYLTIRKEDRS